MRSPPCRTRPRRSDCRARGFGSRSPAWPSRASAGWCCDEPDQQDAAGPGPAQCVDVGRLWTLGRARAAAAAGEAGRGVGVVLVRDGRADAVRGGLDHLARLAAQPAAGRDRLRAAAEAGRAGRRAEGARRSAGESEVERRRADPGRAGARQAAGRQYGHGQARHAEARHRARDPGRGARAHAHGHGSAQARTLALLKSQSALVPAPGQIDRRASGTARERAAAEFRRAVGLINSGRVAEGLDGLRAALKIDPSYDEVRQTLVALLIEAKRMDEAATVLRAGLALEPSNTGFAVLLARVLVEHNDVAGALGLLQQHAAAGEGDPQYHAFAAALYQRLERHGDAVAEYQAALKLAPNAGVWWLGLGISQQALNRPKEAVQAFQRAKASGTLAPDLAAFTDKRLKLLQ